MGKMFMGFPTTPSTVLCPFRYYNGVSCKALITAAGTVVVNELLIFHLNYCSYCYLLIKVADPFDYVFSSANQ